ncbi:MAG: hypothetical protein N3B12_01135 [Armatimonadetes bacterium]|nr:hypothetical protein [Armatimonadota bacterium]
MMVLDQPWMRAYHEKPGDRIDLPICEGCQMARANKHWPKDHLARMEGWTETTLRILEHTAWREIDLADIPEPDRANLATWLEERSEEDLCELCFEIRRQTRPIRLLGEWEGDLLYLRVKLDLKRLAEHGRPAGGSKESCLEYLHKEYLSSVYPEIDENLLSGVFASFPLVADFVEDYKSFLGTIWNEMKARYSGRVEQLAFDLFCVGLADRSEALDILKMVGEYCIQVFPKLFDLPQHVETPIGVAMSISNNKHPFFDHWRFLDALEPDVPINVVGSGRASFRLPDLNRVIEALKTAPRKQLHNLAAAARVSKSLGELILRDKDSRIGKLSGLVPECIESESARVLANLMEG